MKLRDRLYNSKMYFAPFDTIFVSIENIKTDEKNLYLWCASCVNNQQ